MSDEEIEAAAGQLAEPATGCWKPVVTLFEQSGAGAETIGERVAVALGLPFHAQAFSTDDIEGGRDAALKDNAMLATVFAVMGGAYGGFEGRDIVTTQEQKHDLIASNNAAVWKSAEDGGVIVGRNATVILAERPRTVHVLLTGTVEDRVARAAADAGIPVERAARRQEREDQVRAEMSKVLYGWDPRLPERYDIVINTSRVSPDAAVAAIVNVVREIAP